MLSAIERCKERLLALGPQSPAARKQILTSVTTYWRDQPGIGVNIVDKLLNYTILTPMSVIEWVFLDHNERGRVLAHSHIYEMVASTVFKVTNRVRQILQARDQPGLPADQRAMLEETLRRERDEQNAMFQVIDDALSAFAEGTKDEMFEGNGNVEGEDPTEVETLIKAWGARWLRVFRRKAAVEDAVVGEVAAAAAADARDQAEAEAAVAAAAAAAAAAVKKEQEQEREQKMAKAEVVVDMAAENGETAVENGVESGVGDVAMDAGIE